MDLRTAQGCQRGARNVLLALARVWAIGATGIGIDQYRHNPTIFSKAGPDEMAITYVGDKRCQTHNGGDVLICGDDFAIAKGAGGYRRVTLKVH